MKMNFSRVMRLLSLRYKNHEAIVNVERNRRFNFEQYHLLTNRVADALRTTLQVGKGDKFMLILENDNLSLMMFPTVFKQEGTVVMTNLRDPLEEHVRQIELVRPKVVFNSRTGTVVVGQGVRVKAAAVSHGSLTVTIS